MLKAKIKLLLLFLGLFVNNFYSQTPLCISLGSACGSAMNLRDLGVRAAAYPFDWTVSPFDSLYAALNEDFQYFLTDLKIRPGNQGVIDHYGIHFTHDWPTVAQPHIDALNSDFIGNNTLFKEWEKALPLVREKYRRRIARFNEACLGKEKVFFFRSEDISKEKAIVLRDLFRKKYPSLDFVLIVVRNDLTFQEPWHIDGIRNFYIQQWHDPVGWRNMLRQVGPEFRDVSIKKSAAVLTELLLQEHVACCSEN